MQPKVSIDELRKKLPERERRDITSQITVLSDREPKIGMSIPYNLRSSEVADAEGVYTEIIAPGAFARSIKNGAAAKRNGDVVALWNHDSSMVLGRQSNGTLDFNDGSMGLDAEVTLINDPKHWHYDAMRSIERRDVVGSSFGFQKVKDDWEYDDDGTAVRTLIEVRLFDVSPVTYPAYQGSTSEKRSVLDAVMVAHRVDVRELAQMLNTAAAGKVLETDAGKLKTWITRLQTFVPEPAPDPIQMDYLRRFDLKMKSLDARGLLRNA